MPEMSSRDATWAIIELLNENTPVVRAAFVDSACDPGRFFDMLSVSGVGDRLSSGEKILVEIARAVWNGSRNAALADLMQLNRSLRLAVLAVIQDVWSR